MLRSAIGVATLLAAVFSGPIAPANEYRLAHTFQSATPTPGDFFGTAVAIEDGVVAIKSESGSFDGDGLSITHIFEQTNGGWDEVETLTFDNGGDRGNPYIGQELAIDGGEIAITYTEQHQGIVVRPIQFATRESAGWAVTTNEPTFIHPLDPDPPFAFYGDLRIPGRGVDISGDRVIVDDPGAVRSGGVLGAARVFERGGDGLWREAANLIPEGYGDLSIFSVAIDGDTAALVDRGFFTENGAEPPGVFFFERDDEGAWTQTKSFFPVTTDNDDVDEVPYNAFVEIDGDIAASRDLVTGDVTIFHRGADGWEFETELPADYQPLRNFFGFALEGDLLAVGLGPQAVALDDGVPSLSGDLTSVDPSPVTASRVEVYRRSDSGDWSLIEIINDPEPEVGRQFGASLAFDQGRLLVGASATFTLYPSATTTGAAYLFVPVPEPSTVVLIAWAGVAGLCRRK